MKKLLFALCLFTLFACGGDDNSDSEIEACTTEVRYAFRITVTNASNGSPLEDVTITAREEMFEQVLSSESSGVYVGPAERPGNYLLIIEKEDFQTIVTTSMLVEEDECGVVTETLAYALQPL